MEPDELNRRNGASDVNGVMPFRHHLGGKHYAQASLQHYYTKIKSTSRHTAGKQLTKLVGGMNNLFDRNADRIAKWTRRAHQKPSSPVAHHLDVELPSWTQHNGFPLFSHLPPEIRRKIWHLCMPRHQSQFVEIVPKSLSPHDSALPHDPSLCSRKCKAHRPLGWSPFPPPLQVCRESRAEFLNIYTPFSCATFTSACINSKTDSLRPMQCQQSCRHCYYPVWDLNGNIFAKLATNPDAVASIVSLTLCVCQLDMASLLASNFHNAQNLFRKYKNLKELIFAKEGTRELLEENKIRGLLPQASTSRWPSLMVDDELRAGWLQEILDRAATRSGGWWKSPRVRCVMVMEGEVVWERTPDLMVQNRSPPLRP